MSKVIILVYEGMHEAFKCQFNTAKFYGKPYLGSESMYYTIAMYEYETKKSQIPTFGKKATFQPFLY